MNSYKFTRYWHSLGVPTISTGEPSLLNFLKTFLASIATSLNSMRKVSKIKTFFWDPRFHEA
jgi:hypothetical protein